MLSSGHCGAKLMRERERERESGETVPWIAAAASEQDLTVTGGGTTTRKGETAMSKAPRADNASSSARHQKARIQRRSDEVSERERQKKKRRES